MDELEDRIAELEAQVRKLETENKYLKAQLAASPSKAQISRIAEDKTLDVLREVTRLALKKPF